MGSGGCGGGKGTRGERKVTQGEGRGGKEAEEFEP